MFKEGTYVRCNVDYENSENPRIFLYGKIKNINEFKEEALVEFYDTNGIKKYYEIQDNGYFSLNKLTHAKIKNESKVIYKNIECIIKASEYNNEDNFYYYYVITKENKIIRVCESEIIASCNDGEAKPLEQMINYEFHNPIFYIGHANVCSVMELINNSLYGFKELAGCKIFLKSYQLKTIMRCLKYNNCRYIIADEVGMGKTIEALSILKVFLKNKYKQHVAIIVPNSLVEQWKTELAFKFKLFIGSNVNENIIDIYSYEDFQNVEDYTYDFVIADEVHKILNNKVIYNNILNLSKHVNNIIMLSATPIQKRKEEFQKLLILIQPLKYETMSTSKFDKLLDNQNSIIRAIHDILENLDSLYDEIRDNGNSHTDDTNEIYDELLESLNDLDKIIDNPTYMNIVSELNYEDDNFDIEKIQKAISFVCENYQLEKSIIRSRKNNLIEESNKRELLDLSYDINSENNTNEFLVYDRYVSWITDNSLMKSDNKEIIMESVKRLFSSSKAFVAYLESVNKNLIVPDEIIDLAKDWDKNENKKINNIKEILDFDFDSNQSRIINIINYIDQELIDEKVLIFTDYSETFDVYKEALLSYFGESKCCFFKHGMSRDDLELNAYRFQNDENFTIMLSDYSGGEGRNFQNAKAIIHIDIPWHANNLEQRIGRLDRIGRNIENPVLSVVCYARDTIENDLFNLWDRGLNIFTTSQSGLEIVMNEIDMSILGALEDNFKYGINSLTPKIVELIQDLKTVVKKERYFDLATYQYSNLNKILDKTISMFNNNETTLFSDAMMNWASTTGFNGKQINKKEIAFSPYFMSYGSMKKTLFIPPDMKKLIDDKMNQMRNRVRQLNGLKETNISDNTIYGTFDRAYAIANDYIHFFAPGDEIFDSIINNAVGNYRGASSAFGANSDINWTGLIFRWKLEINDTLIYKNNLSFNNISQYRSYLPNKELYSAFTFGDTNYSENDIIFEFKKILNRERNGYHLDHYGKRNSQKFYDFIRQYPKNRWASMLNDAFLESKNRIYKQLEPILSKSINELKIALNNEIGVQKTINDFYDDQPDFSIKEFNKRILLTLGQPKLVLDSICFIKMVKNND